MDFRVIFSPHQEFLVEKQLTDISELIHRSLGGSVRDKVTRKLPARNRTGIHLLDLYRKETGDDQVSINDIPRSIAEKLER